MASFTLVNLLSYDNLEKNVYGRCKEEEIKVTIIKKNVYPRQRYKR